MLSQAGEQLGDERGRADPTAPGAVARMIGEGDGIHRPNFEAEPLQREDGGGIPDMAEGDGITLMTTDELVKQSFASLKTGVLEIRPGQAKQRALMRRLAPDFINRQLWKASKKLVPVGLG